MADVGGASVQALVRAMQEEQLIVSFKYVAREFGLGAAQARRRVAEVARACEAGEGPKIDKVYVLSGFTKAPSRRHVVQLVSSAKLDAAERALDEVTSKYIYSVQPCVLRDASALWSSDYEQMHALFGEPRDAVNNLRDNSLSALTCRSVRRVVAGHPGTGPAPSGPATAKPAAGTGAAASAAVATAVASRAAPSRGISLGPVKGSSKGGISLAGSKPRAATSPIGIGLKGAAAPSSAARPKGISLSGSKAKPKPVAKRKTAKKPVNLLAKKKKEEASPPPSTSPAPHAHADSPAKRKVRQVVMSESESESSDEDVGARAASPDFSEGVLEPEPVPEQPEDGVNAMEAGEAAASKGAESEQPSSVGVGVGGGGAPLGASAAPGGIGTLIGRMKRGAGQGTKPKRKKVFRTTINERGEEVTEEVEVEAETGDKEGGGGEGGGGGRASTSPPTKAKANENVNPHPPPAAKKHKPSPGAKGGARKQVGIASFFAKK